jgi:hypothetical protein
MPLASPTSLLTKAALLKFNALIPPSMLLSPLPIELWPNMCAAILPDGSVQSRRRASNEPDESPARRFVSAMGVPIDYDPDST